MIGSVLTGKELGKFRWLARTPRSALQWRAALKCRLKIKNYHFGAKRWGLAGLL